MSSAFDSAFKQVVSPGPQRLLSGVALAATGSDSRDEDYLTAYGTQQVYPTSSSVTPKTVMWLASCSKLVASVAALQCVERGLFSLDSAEDVDRLLPEWKDPQILTGIEDGKPQLKPAKNKITLRHLLTHTSGLGYDFLPGLLEWRTARGEGPQWMHGTISETMVTPLLFEPGTGWAYGVGLDLAGLMIVRASSCTLEEYLRKNIFDVVGMHDTSFEPLKHGDLAERLMPMTERFAISGLGPQEKDSVFPVVMDPLDHYGGSGLFGTAEDFLKLMKSLLRSDGQLLRPETVDRIFAPSISPESQSALNAYLTIPNPIMLPDEPAVGTPGAREWSYGPAGLIGLTSKEDSLKAPWIQWGGLPNLTWWVDRVGGTCGIFATQLLPPGEMTHQFLGTLFKKEMTKRYRKEA
ncbi:beta-lactamase/transpeptidase-like protein [Massariosphaeria phaeospora]|uniref:Beta-lactamase/transpeptidase-like protein n=1 Tax=Massariosphaeria phaeospora TaxID=100035 RepID=A0A7C8MKR0_9PLEO|nr:beta-lactamase/transpeptidase-like protein [Massariosphaeria phaeospora]